MIANERKWRTLDYISKKYHSLGFCDDWLSLGMCSVLLLIHQKAVIQSNVGTLQILAMTQSPITYITRPCVL